MLIAQTQSNNKFSTNELNHFHLGHCSGYNGPAFLLRGDYSEYK